MAGNTATIDVSMLRVQWDSHSAMASICSYWSITKDQLIRLKHSLALAPRHDRSHRVQRRGPERDPTPTEIRQACQIIQAGWDDRTRYERAVVKPKPFTLRQIEAPRGVEEMLRDLDVE